MVWRTKSLTERRLLTMVRRCTAAAHAVLLFGSLFWSAAAYGAAARHIWPEDETPEQRYWKQVRAKEHAQRQDDEKRQRLQRESVKAAVPDLLRDGEVLQPEMIAAQDGPVPVQKPSVFEGKEETAGRKDS